MPVPPPDRQQQLGSSSVPVIKDRVGELGEQWEVVEMGGGGVKKGGSGWSNLKGERSGAQDGEEG